MFKIIFFGLVIYFLYKFITNFAKNITTLNTDKFKAKEPKFLVALLAKVAKSDGRVNELEARMISQTLDDLSRNFGKSYRDELKAVFDNHKQRTDDAYIIAQEYKTEFNLSKQTCIGRLTFFLNLAYIDGNFADGEREVIGDIARAFEINGQILDQILKRFDDFYAHKSYTSTYQNITQDPYEVLGLEKGANMSDVKKRYRELVRKYHPDILMGQGESEEVIELSTKKLQEINEAYERIQRERG